MGNDGGSIPKRRELVKVKKAKLRNAEDNLLNKDRWKYCALSKETLCPPIVCCKKSKLYNKDSVIEYLLNPNDQRAGFEHIRTLKDLKNVNLCKNLAPPKSQSVATEQIEFNDATPFVCPVNGKELNGSFKFLRMSPCGCVISDLALKEIASESCLACGKAIKGKFLLNNQG